MEQTFSYRITEKEAGKTVGDFLQSRGFSRRLLAKLRRSADGIRIGEGAFLPARTSRRLEGGDLLTVRLPEDPPSETIVPVRQDFKIIYEDRDLMVIDKPAGMPVHPSQGNYTNTLANGLAWYFCEKGEPFTFRAVNRLDRDTTGLLLIAKHGLSAAVLSDMVAKKTVKRQYIAVVSGKTKADGTVCAPIARADGSTIERCVDMERGEYACTRYRRLSYFEDRDCSLLSLVLDTGRTHQIRVHMKYIGHPLLGDFLYNPDYSLIGRQSLHSFCLSFTHPVTGRAMEFTAEIPEDLKAALGLCKPL